MTREKRYPWTAAEDAILRAGYDKARPLKMIAKQIGRTWKTCGTRAKRLGLVHPNGTRNTNRISAWGVLDAALNSPDVPHLPYVPGLIVTGRYKMVRAHVE